ncbi:hypothetical protein [Allokutzneria oryzae]|uniref:Uncharacterized protein n=1 Tax=Allokutzneria oryzae TaxID=1378989 RepID=A0ABV5ZZK0_9PSEU
MAGVTPAELWRGVRAVLEQVIAQEVAVPPCLPERAMRAVRADQVAEQGKP